MYYKFYDFRSFFFNTTPFIWECWLWRIYKHFTYTKNNLNSIGKKHSYYFNPCFLVFFFNIFSLINVLKIQNTVIISILMFLSAHSDICVNSGLVSIDSFVCFFPFLQFMFSYCVWQFLMKYQMWILLFFFLTECFYISRNILKLCSRI